MIGNDIVDLALSRTESNWKRKGWVQKIFTAIEQHYIFEADHPEIQVWKFWSMKEAVYKAHQRRFGHLPKYNPKDFNCTLGGEVTIGKCVYKTSTMITEKYIYSIAKASNIEYDTQIFDETLRMHPLLLQKIAENYKIDSSIVTIKKDGNGIPMVRIDQKAEDIPISITHHGQYSAFVIGLE
ncbi:4'-phosphopantetheinyl transferase superfamily protein [Aquimarina algiphila]|uniref:4'-phosphopantetheinyl transferase superfamily protein n=1 Tax=Aquimarina algiphila TaxID=2047982 RepID=UPI00232FFA50|nr:4'-phosphopantetheinyl transferase superfamily protein [Aquimarina algiphila]